MSNGSRMAHKWWTLIAVLTFGVLAVVAVSRAGDSGRLTQAGHVPQIVMYHGVNQTLLQACMAKQQNCTETVPGLAHCMKVHRRCNNTVSRVGWLGAKVPSGTKLLTRQQVLADNGGTGSNIKRATVLLTTYGALHREDPALAASTTINPERPVYLVTEWFVKPEVVDISVPQGAPAQGMVKSEQLVVDAVTGQVTDYTP